CVTTDKCYRNNDSGIAFRETDPLGCRDPYGGSKAAAELAIRSYRETYFNRIHGVQVASARAGNVIGGGDWTPFALMPDLIRSLSAGDPVPIRNPDSIRPWQHVLQALDGYLTLAATMAESPDTTFCDAWNFGPFPGQSVSVRQVADWVIQAWGKGRWEYVPEEELSPEAPQLTLAVDKAVSYLDWRPVWNTYQATLRTVEWYLDWFEGESASEICKNQIRAYQLDRDDCMTALLAHVGKDQNEEVERL
ncbi:MAG: NAD-dependent epimerase/dehydratase family protein, partial [Planctomycetota bacterium]